LQAFCFIFARSQSFQGKPSFLHHRLHFHTRQVMMCTLGECDDGLRPLDSFLQFTATLESYENNSGNNGSFSCNGPYKLSPENLILANRTVVYNNMAQAWYEQRHFEHALWSLENALEALREFHREGGKEPASNNTISTLLSNMGYIHSRLGDMDKALNYSIEAYQSHDGTEDDFRASLLYNLGRLLFILDRSSAEAEHALSYSLRIITNIESESRERDIVTVQTLLLIIQEQRERESDAVAVALLRALVHQRSEFGYENHSVAETLCQLGEIYTRRYQHEHAVMFLCEALRVQRQIGVPDIELLLTLSRLGRSLHSCGQHAEAMLSFREALRLKGSTIYREAPRGQVIFATVLYNVGMIQSVHGNHEDRMLRRRALQSFQICLDLRTKALGRMHPDVASALHNIGFLLLQDGQPLKSLEVFRESLAIRCQTLGLNHHEVASSLRHIGCIYQDRGEHEKALRLYMKAFLILQTSQRDCSDDLVEVLMGLGQSQYSTGRVEQALASYKEAAKLLRYRQHRGNEVSAHHVARVLNIMGNLALEMSDVAAAREFFAEAASLSESSNESVSLLDEMAGCAAAA
jgi:tetratricopeptide (TPR) repeat protein